jgi:cytidylate kinase
MRTERHAQTGRRGRHVITIDGPAGVGKTTTARAIASQLGFVYLDSGALYRGLALLIRDAGLDAAATALPAFLDTTGLDARPTPETFSVLANGTDLTDRLRAPELGGLASAFATLPVVRDQVRGVLRSLAGRYDCVAEGRDMGSVVFPEASLKIFLEAPPAERARRRHLEFVAGGIDTTLADVERDMARRDERDRERETSPLRPAPDAVRVCNADLTVTELAELVVALYRGGGWTRGSRFQRSVKTIGRGLLSFCYRIEIRGRERVPRGPHILASNHRAGLDPVILGIFSPGTVAFLSKAELFAIPGLRQLLQALYAIPLRRGQFDKRALEAALLTLRRGLTVAIFPEGTRVRDPRRAHPRRGVALLARRAQVPVVPVCLQGTDHPWRAALRLTPIRIRYGTPLSPPSLSEPPVNDEQFLTRVMQAIAALAEGGERAG